MFHLARKIVTALENKYLDIDPHPSVRLLGKRDAYTIIFGKVFETEVANGKVSGKTNKGIEVQIYVKPTN